MLSALCSMHHALCVMGQGFRFLSSEAYFRLPHSDLQILLSPTLCTTRYALCYFPLPPPHQIFMNRVGSFAASPHGQNNRGRAGHNITPGPNAFFKRLTSLGIRVDISPSVQLQIRRRLGQQGIGTGTYRHNTHVTFQFKLRPFDGNRPATSWFGTARKPAPTVVAPK